MNYFELFELPVSFKIDKSKLAQKYFELQKKYHPDFFSNSGENEQDEMLERSSDINKAYKTFQNKDWSKIYEDSKSRLLDELDFSGFNTNLISLRYFINKCFDIQKKEMSIRCCYILLSHSLIILDYLIKKQQ